MAELTREQHDTLGGSFSTEPFYGGFISLLHNIYMPGKSAQVAGSHYQAWINMVDSLARQLSCASTIYVYKDSADGNAEFSVRLGIVPCRNLLCEYAGETGLGDLSTGENKVWLDLSSAPTVTADYGADWPTGLHIPLAIIDMPATGAWLSQHITRMTGSHALHAAGDGVHPVVKSLGYDSTSPLTIGTVAAGARIVRVHLKIEIPFNGTAPTLEIGDTGVADRLMAAGDNDPKTADTYITYPLHEYSAQTDVTLTITPDGSTAGAGLVFLEVA